MPDAQDFRRRLKREETLGYLDSQTVDQEVGGSNPPSCTSIAAPKFLHTLGHRDCRIDSLSRLPRVDFVCTAGIKMIALRRLYRLIAAVCLLLAGSAVVSADAQDRYPTRPITIVVPFAAGGPTDILARLIGQSIGPMLG